MPVALITGASSGIGRATALRLTRSGWTVLAGVRDAAAGERLVAEAAGGVSADDGVRTDGAGVTPITLDVTDAAQVAAAAASVQERTGVGDGAAHGKLDALVNNAGIGVGGPLELLPLDDLRRQLDVNVLGQVAVTQALLPALRSAGGRIVFVSSIGGLVSLAFNGPYAASKHAVEAIGDALRGELRSSGVGVALVEPGSVATPIWDKSKAEVARVAVPPELEKEYGRVPQAMQKILTETGQRGIRPERVAETIESALTARRMKARYLIGRDAKAMLLLRRLLPDLVFDRVTMRAIGV